MKVLTKLAVIFILISVISSCWNKKFTSKNIVRASKFTGDNITSKKIYDYQYQLIDTAQYEDCSSYKVIPLENKEIGTKISRVYHCANNERGLYVVYRSYENNTRKDTIVSIAFKANPNYVYTPNKDKKHFDRTINNYPYIADGKAKIGSINNIPDFESDNTYLMLIPFHTIYMANSISVQEHGYESYISKYKLGFENYRQEGSFKNGIREGTWMMYDGCTDLIGGIDPIEHLIKVSDNSCQNLTKYNFKNGYVEGSADYFSLDSNSNYNKDTGYPVNYKHSKLNGWLIKNQVKEISADNEIFLDSILYENGVQIKTINFKIKIPNENE